MFRFFFIFWKRLFAGTLPANKNLFAGTVPANKNLFAGTPQVRSIFTFPPEIDCLAKKMTVRNVSFSDKGV